MAVGVFGQSMSGTETRWCKYAKVGVFRRRGERLGNVEEWGRPHRPVAIVRIAAFTASEEEAMEGSEQCDMT